MSAQEIQTAVAPATGAGPIVQLEAIRKSFGDNLVLDGIDLEVAPRERTACPSSASSPRSTSR